MVDQKISALFYSNVILGTPAAVVGFGGAVVLLVATVKTNFLPGNVRALLINMCVGYALMQMDAVRVMVDAWIVVATGYFVRSRAFCHFVTVSYALPALMTNFSVLALGAERAVSTRRLLKELTLSDTVSRGVKVVIVATWLFSIFICTLIVNTPFPVGRLEHYRNVSNNDTVEWCVAAQEGILEPIMIWPLCFVMSTQEIVGLLLVVIVLKLNQHEWQNFSMTSDKHNLQLRFELRRNIYFTEIVIPAVGIHVVCVTVVSCMYFTAALRPKLYDSFYDVLMASTYDLIARNMQQIHAVALPLILFWRNYHFKSALYANNRVEQGVELSRAQVPSLKINNLTDESLRTGQARVIIGKPQPREVRDYQLDPDANMIILDNIWKASASKIGLKPEIMLPEN